MNRRNYSIFFVHKLIQPKWDQNHSNQKISDSQTSNKIFIWFMKTSFSPGRNQNQSVAQGPVVQIRLALILG